jgi:redox-sensitive bicupin YhaK (pirin superfamily)
MDKRAPVIPSTIIYPTQAAQVGDGFFIQRAIPIQGKDISAMEPFLMLDHAGPTLFSPTDTPRGVDVHPHKGFQTVTLAYQGDLVHRDSAGNKGHLHPGDVQWMTAGNGIVHEEKHGPELSKKGGYSEMIQLWINLPAKDKGVEPHYTDFKADIFPVIPLAEQGMNPLTLADVYLEPGLETAISLDPSWHTGLYVLRGDVIINGRPVDKHSIARIYDEKEVILKANASTHILFMSAKPIAEPIASYGPFVMNTQAEIKEAIAIYNRGEMGAL